MEPQIAQIEKGENARAGRPCHGAVDAGRLTCGMGENSGCFVCALLCVLCVSVAYSFLVDSLSSRRR